MSDPKTNDVEWLTTRTFLLLLAAALLAAFPGIASGVHTFFYRDFGALGYPGVFFTRESLWHGQLPLWNPYSHCGVPWLAQMQQWYLPAWLCYLLPLPWSADFLLLAHLWFGGAGMFWLLRRWKLGNFAAALAAFAFVFNGVSLSCLQWGNYIAALSWLPWILGAVMGAWHGGGRLLALAAIASAMQVLTATPEITLLTWILIGALWLCEVFSSEIGFTISARRIGLVVFLAAGITMIQMLPFFDLLAHSQRNSGNTEAAIWSMPAWGWANLVVPLFHCYVSPEGTWFQHGQDFLQSYYLGAGVLALAVTGVIAKQNRTAVLIGIAILFCWLIALGTNGFLYGPFKAIFPLIGVARFPIKFMILTAFLVPLLAARGVDQLQASSNKTARRISLVTAISLVCLTAALLYLARRFPFPNDDWNATAGNALCRIAFLAALVGGIFLSLKISTRMGRITVQLIVLAILPLDALTHSPNLAQALPSVVLAAGIWQSSGKPALEPGEGRIMVSPNAEQELLYSRVADMQTDFIGKRLAEWYNLNLLDGLPKVNGAITLRPADFDILERYLYYTRGGHCGRGLVDFLSVAWLSSPDNPTKWIGRTDYLPLITAGQKPVFASDEETLQAITANDFDPKNVVYLPETAHESVIITNQTACIVTNARFALNQVEADVKATAPSLVVLSQSYYHLWRVFVDEKPAPLLRANLAFQAVEVPTGEHHVKWIYRDPYLETGAAVSLLSLAACVLVYRRPESGGTFPFTF
jgi:hypothetical protein